jgi:hypothetical protein
MRDVFLPWLALQAAWDSHESSNAGGQHDRADLPGPWQIELFFKALKQNLKVKTFVGTSENALRIQIWTALLALLLLKWLHYLSQAGWSLSNLAHMLRLNLFTYRDLPSWLNNPTETPPLIPDPQQLPLPLSPFGQLVPRNG